MIGDEDSYTHGVDDEWELPIVACDLSEQDECEACQ